MLTSITTRAFAKVIISGEHAVVYGKPALALSVDRYVTTSIIPSSETNKYTFILENFGTVETFDWQQLQAIGQSKTLQSLQLLPYALTKLLTNFAIKTDAGLEIRVFSTIPINCGLGSSAALIVSLLHAINHFFALQIKTEDYLPIASDIEHIQHGKSSGLDVYLAIYGGGVRFENEIATPRTFSYKPSYYVNSGKAQSSTWQCVNTVARYFRDSSLANDFGCIVDELDKSLQAQDVITIKENIRINNQLLNYIGVVPEKVQRFIKDIEDRNGAAKICGAGAVEGDTAGIIMVIVDDDITALLIKYGYERLELKSNNYGVQII